MSNILLRGSVLSVALLLSACGSSSNPGGAGGTGAGTGGSTGGSTGGGTGGSGAAFMAVAPCAAESDYQEGSTISFPGTNMSYAPKCLRVAVGATVTFMATGTESFVNHSLEASRRRGNTTDNPIVTVSSGTTREFTFSAPGFFAYYCGAHGISDMDSGEVGVVWVR